MTSERGGLAERLRAEPRLPLEGLTCDLWFTLVSVPDAERRRWEEARRKVWFDAIPDRHDRPTVLSAWQAMRRWIQSREWEGRAPSLTAQCDWLGRRLGATVDQVALERGLTRALQMVDVRWVAGAREALDDFADTGIPVGIVSNIVNEPSAATHALLARLGIDRPIRSVQLSCDLPRSKPDPMPYLRCLSDLGVRPGASAHVGDHRLDAVGARRAGSMPLRFTGGRPGQRRPSLRARLRSVRTVAEVTSWNELRGAWPR